MRLWIKLIHLRNLGTLCQQVMSRLNQLQANYNVLKDIKYAQFFFYTILTALRILYRWGVQIDTFFPLLYSGCMIEKTKQNKQLEFATVLLSHLGILEYLYLVVFKYISKVFVFVCGRNIQSEVQALSDPIKFLIKKVERL